MYSKQIILDYNIELLHKLTKALFDKQYEEGCDFVWCCFDDNYPIAITILQQSIIQDNSIYEILKQIKIN